MSSQGTDKNWFQTAAGGATRWSEAHLWGGAKTFWAIVGLLILGLLLVITRPIAQRGGFGRGGQQGPAAVGVVNVAKGDVAITLNALGTVTPLATVTVRPQVSGEILRMDFTEGQMVKAGDVLAEIDPRPFRAAYDQAVGQLERDKATLANAEVDLGRDQSLYAQKAIAQQILATQQATVKSDAAVVKADQAAVEAAKINLDFTKITSPVAGRVGLRQVDVGNLIQAGQTTGVAVVTQIQPISVLFALPEDNIGDIMGRVNQGATLSVDAYDRGQTVKLATGTLSTVDNQIDPTTGTVKMRAMFDNADGKLFPQQFVNIRLLVNTLHDQTWVPSSAIERGAQGAFVYVVQKDMTVAMRSVTLGPQDGDRVAITKGLAAGETVVTDGADRLHEGSEVVIPKGKTVSAVAPPAGAAAPAGGDARAARRALMQKVCGADIKKFCGDAEGPDRFQCMRDHKSDFSQPCQDAMSKMRGGRHGGGGGGGGGQ